MFDLYSFRAKFDYQLDAFCKVTGSLGETQKEETPSSLCPLAFAQEVKILSPQRQLRQLKARE
jgi:hypothetical protein